MIDNLPAHSAAASRAATEARVRHLLLAKCSSDLNPSRCLQPFKGASAQGGAGEQFLACAVIMPILTLRKLLR
jgi:hypothetical protein